MARTGFGEIASSTLAEATASPFESGWRDPVTGQQMMQSMEYVPGRGPPGEITRTELAGAKFGVDPNAARRIEARRQRRVAAFRQAGGPAMTGEGVVGLGSAQ